MSSHLKLGVIGLSPGNGHPYSWSAIFNGYDPVAMERCGFPVIPRYLEKQHFPQDTIVEAKVTHVWTQDVNLSTHIAKATHIENVVKNLRDFIGNVDAILLARDDAETHLEMARPFLEAGLPIYVDKPLALSILEAEQLIALQQYPGQLFSCSALRYAPELQLEVGQKEKIGEIRSIQAFVPKDWDKYSVHVIEPLLKLIPSRGKIRRSSSWRTAERTSLLVEFSSGVDAQIHVCGKAGAPLGFRVIGADDWCDLFFNDTFRAFRNALQDFVHGIVLRDVRTSSEHMLEVVELIELGRKP